MLPAVLAAALAQPTLAAEPKAATDHQAEDATIPNVDRGGPDPHVRHRVRYADPGPYTGTSPLKSAGVWGRVRINTPDDFPTG
jgi:hypothetical protein